MVGHAHADGADAVNFGTLDGLFRRESGQHMADAVVTVNHRQRTAIDNELRRRHRIHDLVAQPVQIPAQAQYAVGLVAPQIGLHQRVGDQPRIGFGHPLSGIDGSGEIDQFLCNYRCSGHGQDFPENINVNG